MTRLKGAVTLPVLLGICPIDRVENFRGRQPMANDLIDLGESPVPVLRDGHPVLLVDATGRGSDCQWRVLSQEELNKISI